MDDAAMGDPVVTWILMKGGGNDSVGENPHTGGAQHGCAKLFTEGSGIVTVLGVGVERAVRSWRSRGQEAALWAGQPR